MSIHTGKGVVMTYYGAQQLADSFQTVRNNTLRIAEEIPQDKYSFRAAPDTRTVEKTLVHIALSYKFQYMVHAAEPMSTLKGINFLSLIRQMEEEEGKPRTRAEVIVLLRKEGEIWTTFLRGLTEEFLAEQVEMPSYLTPASRSRFEMILSVKEHEMHHRGQLMLMQRMLGMVPALTRDMQARLAQAQKQ